MLGRLATRSRRHPVARPAPGGQARRGACRRVPGRAPERWICLQCPHLSQSACRQRRMQGAGALRLGGLPGLCVLPAGGPVSSVGCLGSSAGTGCSVADPRESAPRGCGATGLLDGLLCPRIRTMAAWPRAACEPALQYPTRLLCPGLRLRP